MGQPSGEMMNQSSGDMMGQSSGDMNGQVSRGGASTGRGTSPSGISQMLEEFRVEMKMLVKSPQMLAEM
jgi:hypothetical protein